MVWHDDGTVKDDAAKDHAMYQRNNAGDALTFQESDEAMQQDHAAADVPTPATGTIPQAAETDLAAAQQEVPSESAALPAEHVTDLFPSEVSSAAKDQATVNVTTVGDVSATLSSSAEEMQDAVASKQHLQSSTDAQDQQAAILDTPAPALNRQQQLGSSTSTAQPSQQQAALPLDNGLGDAAAAIAAEKQPADGAQQQPSATNDVAASSGLTQEAVSTDAAMATTAPVSTDDDVGTPALNNSTNAAVDAAPSADAVAIPAAVPAPVSTTTGGDDSWKGTGKGPGLGQSQEFSGGPVSFTRPKYRHAPYNLPPAMGGGRFGGAAVGGSTWSPRGRSSPRGGMSSGPGRGFAEAPRWAVLQLTLPQFPSSKCQSVPLY